MSRHRLQHTRTIPTINPALILICRTLTSVPIPRCRLALPPPLHSLPASRQLNPEGWIAYPRTLDVSILGPLAADSSHARRCFWLSFYAALFCSASREAVPPVHSDARSYGTKRLLVTHCSFRLPVFSLCLRLCSCKRCAHVLFNFTSPLLPLSPHTIAPVLVPSPEQLALALYASRFRPHAHIVSVPVSPLLFRQARLVPGHC